MPGEFKTLVKSSVETMKAFNTRLRDACENSPVTSFHAVVVDGQPVITLMSELSEADAEDVAEYKADGQNIKEGDLIPIDLPICVQVGGVSAIGDDAAETEHAHDSLNKRAQSECTEVRYFSGQSFVWTPDRNEAVTSAKPKLVLAQAAVVFAAIAYLADLVPAEAGAETTT